MLNVVTDEEGHPAAVLLRGAGHWNGPASSPRRWRSTSGSTRRPIARPAGLWIEDRGYRVPRGEIERTPRIGVDYAGHWAAKPYRFVLEPPLGRAVRRPH